MRLPPLVGLPTLRTQSSGGPSLHFCAANSSGWTRALDHPKHSSAHIVLVQEHELSQDKIGAASQTALKFGWELFWAPALTAAKGRQSGG
eukprot:1203850-Pyramimonas_sp.AAC.1